MLSVNNALAHNTEEPRLYSKHLDREMTYRVTLPEKFSQDNSYMCLYVLDTYNLYDLVVANSAFNNEIQSMPPMIVVGINYSPERNRGLVGLNNEDLSLDSQGQLFQQYIADELIPQIESQYNVGSKRFLIGHSYTATYQLWWMLNSPDTFHGYMMLCPEKDQPIQQNLIDQIDCTNRRVALVAAGEDAPERIRFAKSLTKKIKKQAADCSYTFFKTESHLSVIPAAVGSALRKMFSGVVDASSLYDTYDPEKVSENGWQMYEKMNEINRERFGVPIEKSNDNLLFFTDIAIAQEDVKSMKQLATHFSESSAPDPLKSFNIAYSFSELNQPELCLEYLDRSITESKALNNLQAAWNARRMKATYYWSECKHDFEAAWQELDGMLMDYPQDSVIVAYFKGRISANNNFKSGDGLKCLQICASNPSTLEMWGLTVAEIDYLRAKCYLNEGHIQDALDSIESALKQKRTKEYILFKEKLISKS